MQFQNEKELTSTQVSAPFPEVGASNGRAGGEDGQRDSPLAGGQIFRPFGHNVIAV